MSSDPFIVFAPDVPEEEGRYPAPFDKERLGFFRDLGRAAGSKSIGVVLDRIPPGERMSFTHAHFAEEHRLVTPYASTMAVGWAQDGAVQEQIDATVDSAVKRARSRLARGESLLTCEECDEPIPEARRQALPGVRRCVPCQSEADRRDVHQGLYNRRGSKDSQLK